MPCTLTWKAASARCVQASNELIIASLKPCSFKTFSKANVVPPFDVTISISACGPLPLFKSISALPFMVWQNSVSAVFGLNALLRCIITESELCKQIQIRRRAAADRNHRIHLRFVNLLRDTAAGESGTHTRKVFFRKKPSVASPARRRSALTAQQRRVRHGTAP